MTEGGGGGGGSEKLFYQYGGGLALWAHEHSYEWLWPVYDRKVSLGGGGGVEGGERSCSISTARWVVEGGGGAGGEKLFYQYGVGLALWAHEHSYEQLWPVYDRKVSWGGGGWRGREKLFY